MIKYFVEQRKCAFCSKEFTAHNIQTKYCPRHSIDRGQKALKYWLILVERYPEIAEEILDE